jgi:hypothetical protein
MSNTGLPRSDQANVHVTLETSDTSKSLLSGKKYPCCICGSGLAVRFTRKANSKPYTTCLSCGIQTFFRGQTGIKRLTELVKSNILITGDGSKTELAVILFNRIQQLRTQEKQLEANQPLMARDRDLENAIRAVDNEIQDVQGELNKLARRNSGGRKS